MLATGGWPSNQAGDADRQDYRMHSPNMHLAARARTRRGRPRAERARATRASLHPSVDRDICAAQCPAPAERWRGLVFTQLSCWLA